MSTANVIGTRSGTNWTIDVSDANLDTTAGIKDFIVLHNGVVVPNTDYTKTTSSVLTYTGTALAAGTTVEVRRKTPTDIIQPVSYQSRLSSDLWNKEFERKTRWQEEADLNGTGPTAGGVVPAPRDTPYDSDWNGDTVYPPSRNSVYDKLQTMAPLVSPAFTGVPSTPDTAVGTNTSQVVNTRSLQNELALKANVSSPSFTGTPTAPTADVSASNTTLANTAFVKNVLANGPSIVAPTLSGNSTAVTRALDTNTTQLATMEALFNAVRANANSMKIGTLRVQWGNSVSTTDASANALFTFPTAFNGAPYSVIVCNGDVGVGSLVVGIAGALISTGFAVNVYRLNGTPYTNLSVRINWVAFGPA